MVPIDDRGFVLGSACTQPVTVFESWHCRATLFDLKFVGCGIESGRDICIVGGSASRSGRWRVQIYRYAIISTLLHVGLSSNLEVERLPQVL